MAPRIENVALDGGLSVINSAVTHIYIVGTTEPTTYALATTGNSSTGALGFASLGAGTAFGAPGGTSGTRYVTSGTVTAGTITTTGTAAWWAAVSGSSLYAHGSLASNQGVTAGNTFTLGNFTIGIPNG